MDGKQILEKIIENNGSCRWLKGDISACINCPLGNKNGKRVCCVDTVFKGKNANMLNVNALFLEAAKKALLDILAEEMLIGAE